MHSANKEKVGRVVFGEASGESDNGKLEVAYTIVNRVNHAGFPNSLNAVVNQTYKSGGKTFHHYNTLDNSGHDKRWEAAKEPGATEHAAYNSAITQAGHALCGTKSDPMNCGPVNFCAKNPCSATNSNKYCYTAYKERVGRLVFGEAPGEPANAQLEVAYTVVNRISHPGFPNSLDAVVDQTYISRGKTYHQ
ncbi:Hypothetical predicted protein [Mytilus galloprovincialis]|uniref:Cell wall hydrolase SleB domain-containing protein n=1 Tax=Mytilus galloprovincialis TaxID=29158 RepID=A0A8B6EZE5_MYTGA|nr:Hypothetical predicted protein [Mytilus galloprovincialis]